jgi:hypothetical protein
LHLLVLAAGRGACMGVDLDSGALTVAQWHGGADPGLAAFDLAMAVRSGPAAGAAGAVVPADPARPEAVLVERAPGREGRMRRRVAERYLRPLLLGPKEHLLGFAGSTVPYWTLDGFQPSLCLVAPPGGVTVTADRTVRFTWRGWVQELPLAHAALPVPTFSRRPRLAGAALADTLGFLPRRLLVALSPPRAGLCHKVTTALLP